MSHSWYENEEPASVRKFSFESDDQGGLRRSKKKKMIGTESLANSLASNLNKISQGPLEVNKMFLTDDYFSDVNPRSMRYEGSWSLISSISILMISRRLMNVIYVMVSFLMIGVAVHGKTSGLVTSLPIVGGITACGIFLLIISVIGLIGAVRHHQVGIF